MRVADPDGAAQPTVATVAMNVDSTPARKGTHMSRFVEVLGAHAVSHSTPTALGGVGRANSRRASTRHGARIASGLPVLRRALGAGQRAAAPVEYDGQRLHAEAADEDRHVGVGVRVAGGEPCPCSKEISDYGAHNQRGYVDIDVESCAGGDAAVWIEDLIGVAEDAASAPVYALLKRPDERFVTMQAYENPAFVEDIARDVAVALREDVRGSSRSPSRVRNLESIHAHNAVATIRGRR